MKLGQLTFWQPNVLQPANYLHESILLHSRQSRHIHPTRALALPQIVPLALDRSETDSSQAMNLQTGLLGLVVRYDVDVGFFACSDLVSD